MHKRIVIKIGTKVLFRDSGMLAGGVLKELTDQIGILKKRGVEVVVVTSGAVGFGRGLIDRRYRRKGKPEETIALKQMYAAVGQVRLMEAYEKLFARRDYLCAQVLVTKEDFRDKRHYLNMKDCFSNLLKDNIVPVVNENDVIAIHELVFTDNDELAGLVASQLDADAVIILTSVDGVIAGDPKDANARVIPKIGVRGAPALQKFIRSGTSEFGRGGMLTKFNIAKKLAAQGITVHIANGTKENVIIDIVDGKRIGTTFVPDKKTSSFKRRIAYSEGLARGAVVINQCAEDILCAREKIVSLLPVGVTKVSGEFGKWDIIEIRNEKNKVLGFGVAQYDFRKARQSMGTKNARPMIHYDHMFIW